MTDYFLWPRAADYGGMTGVISGVNAAGLEASLSERFPGAYPVAVSSGRAGLALMLAMSGIGRRDKVGVFPFASHCVLEAIVRYALPTDDPNESDQVSKIIYHQWGYVQRRTATPWLEDAVDSLCLSGTALLPLGGDFELWSLPKIFGVASGGVVWCRKGETAEQLRRVRDTRGGGVRQLLLRVLGSYFPRLHGYWAGMEAECGPMPTFVAANARHALDKLDIVIADRRRKFDMLASFAPGWLPKVKDRLPCVVPVETTNDFGERLTALGITTGFRHFHRIKSDDSDELIRVFPIPIHQQMSLGVLDQAMALLERVPPNVANAAHAYVT